VRVSDGEKGEGEGEGERRAVCDRWMDGLDRFEKHISFGRRCCFVWLVGACVCVWLVMVACIIGIIRLAISSALGNEKECVYPIVIIINAFVFSPLPFHFMTD